MIPNWHARKECHRGLVYNSTNGHGESRNGDVALAGTSKDFNRLEV